MSNENNIQDFDNFFREAFNNFEPPAPQGVWEGIQSQLGTAQGAGAAGTGAATKTGFWGLGKIIIGSVTAVAVVTTVYIAAINNSDVTDQGNNTELVQGSQTGSTDGTSAGNSDELSGNNHVDAEDINIAKPPVSQHGGHKNDGSETTNVNSPNNYNNDSSPIVDLKLSGPDERNLRWQGTEKNTPPQPDTKNQTSKTTVALYTSDNKLCVKEEVTITIADDISKYTYRVNFGDGTSALTAKGKPLSHKYSSGGMYKITAADLTGTREAMEQTVEVSKVKAGFTVENVEKAIFKFTNTSEGANQYSWFFGDGKEGSNLASPVYAYTNLDAAEYKVKLIAISENGCVDSFTQRVKQTYTYDDIKPIIPNVFSPNGDGINDRFDIGIRNEEFYHLEIVDRSGNKVFESFSKENTWDGKNIFNGEECPAATYMMVFVYKIKGFEEKKVTGTVSIKR